MQLFDLTGKVAVVTGGNGGIGLGMADGLARAGASVAVVGRNEEKNERAVDRLRGHEGEVISVQADVTDEEAVIAMVETVGRHLGGIDILVNNAGSSVRKRPEELTKDEYEWVIETNLTSAFLCSKYCYPEMKKAGRGKILNNGSMMSIFGSSFAAAYGSSKGGILQLTRSQAVAWAPDDIQVNCFLPGWIDTELTRGARRQVPGLNEKVLSRTPAGRWGEIDDMAGLAVFLASPASDFITGTAIPIDGGFSIMI
ncbi:MAG: glucose 1-dehydrogenase [Pseudomonadota bacterium]